nr:hypothetical protein 6 [Gammaproteobacteria bacterium]
MTNKVEKTPVDSKVQVMSARFLRLLVLSVVWALLFGGLGVVAALITREMFSWPYLPELVFLVFMSLGVAKIGGLIRPPHG